ncbi:hypothetical protein FB451DRAFT_1178577 [Mycena latifolia]|nr:hypothetical protein FB451DRAFT_1178577 [Mycena latifolia]
MNFLTALLASFLAVAAANPVGDVAARVPCLTLPFLLCDGGIDQDIACGDDAWKCPGNGLHPIISNATCAAQYQISVESDGLIRSYGIVDRDPTRGDINFLSIGPLASFAIAISPPFLPRFTTLGARSDPPMLAFHLKRYWTATD